MRGECSVLLAEAVSPLHVGAGRGEGVVDLPVDRDGFGFPFLPASGVKGAIRERWRGEPSEKEIFGDVGIVGKFLPQDGLLLATPARTLRGVWALVTSPFLLRRLKLLLDLAGRQNGGVAQVLEKTDNLGSEQALATEHGKRAFEIEGKILLNEEFELELKVVDAQSFTTQLGENGWRLVVVHDDLIREIVNGSLLRRARVALNSATKTVEKGGLWEEEDIPPCTLFSLLFFYADAQTRESLEGKLFEKKSEGFLVLGGHETVGRGIVRIRKW